MTYVLRFLPEVEVEVEEDRVVVFGLFHCARDPRRLRRDLRNRRQ